MSVWTDWLDIVPVVGTLQTTVEAISAICHGAYDFAKENRADTALSLVLDVLTLGTAVDPGSAHLKVAEKVVMKGLGSKEIMNAMEAKGGKSGKGRAAKSVKGAGKKPAATQINVKELASTSKKPSDPKTVKGEQRKPSHRGEHVINNNVLKVFRTIIDRFADKIGRTAAQLLEKKEHTAAYKAYYTPLPEATTQSIGHQMVAYLREEDQYIDANATQYGAAIKEISDMVVTYMYDYYTNNSWFDFAVDKSIIDLILLLNNGQLYVDEYAKQYWLQQGGNVNKFEECRQDVVQMFRRLCAPTSGENEAKQWVRDLTGHA